MAQQTKLGLILLVLLLVSGAFFLETIQLFFRLLIGLGFGYVMARTSMGFAGGLNSLARTGSSNLAASLMIMFTLTAIITAFFIYGNETAYHLKINPINMGLILGGLLFGFGMTFSSCCATGSLMDMSGGFSRAIVSLFFLCFGVFVGFSVQSRADFVKESYLTSKTGEAFQGGVFLPDLLTFDGFNGYLMASIVTALLAGLVIVFARMYEKNYFIKNNMTPGTPQEPRTDISLAERIFVTPWKRRVSVVMVSLLFASLLFLYDKGWSASSAFGLWFAKILMLFGIGSDAIVSFTGRSAEFINKPLFSHATSVQNFAIMLGAFFYLMIAGKFKEKFIAGLLISKKDILVYAFGGFVMGFGTRLSNGCNVGALYTPIAEFSLSGWIYLIVIVIGGFFGHYVLNNYINKTCNI